MTATRIELLRLMARTRDWSVETHGRYNEIRVVTIEKRYKYLVWINQVLCWDIHSKQYLEKHNEV
jgi:hypothetical protein